VRAILVAFAFVCAADAANALDIAYTANHGAPACRSEETLERWLRVARTTDNAALYKLTSEVLLNGQCISINKGERLFGDAVPGNGTIIKVHREGDPTEYFAYWEHFTRDQAAQKHEPKPRKP
jgi:hypothetical protein